MVRKCCLLAVVTVLGSLWSASRGFGQAPAPVPAVPVGTEEPDLLPGLPRPPDAPRSLFQEAPATPPFHCDPLPGPYFERDPRLDPPTWPQPDWFAGVDLGVVGPHVKNRLVDTVQVGSRMPDTIHTPGADLNWTVSPSVALGYRLPSGFGEFALTYRELATDGSGTVLGSDGIMDVKSRLDVNIADLDYLSREMSLWPHWGMKWWFGLRMANVYFDSQANEGFAAAAAGSGILGTHTTNHFLGGGPHYGLELTRHWEGTGLCLTMRADGATLLGRVQQDFLEIATSAAPPGALIATSLMRPYGALPTGETRESNPQDVPMLNVFLGVTWQPPRYPSLHVSAGYEYEYWWNVGRLSTGMSRGEWSEQGILVRAGFNF